MMKNKKTLIAIIAAAVAVVLVAGYFIFLYEPYVPDSGYHAVDPGELPEKVAGFDYQSEMLKPYDQEITITVAAIDYPLESNVKQGTTPYNQSFNRIAKEVLNINLEYTVVGSTANYDQRLNLAITANEEPDMFYTTDPKTFADLRDNGKLADLGPSFWYLNEELQNVYLNVMPEILPNAMVEGKLYAFPMASNKYESAQKLYIRKDWLDICNAQAPTTIAELIALGETFLTNKDKIAAATGVSASSIIPLSFHKELMWTGTASASGLMQAHGASPNAYFLGEDGKLYASNTSQEMKNALATMNTMYQKGIIDKSFNTKNVDMVYDDIKSGKTGMLFGQWWLPHGEINNTVSNIPGADWVCVDLPSYNGQASLPVVKRVALTGYNCVSSKCQYPEAAAKLINLFYDVYYNDNAYEIYGEDVKPENGFFYNMVPIKLWNSIASIEEYKRVNAVFKEAYAAGMTPAWNVLSESERNALSEQDRAKYDSQLAIYNKLKTREKDIHWKDGYDYYYAVKQGKSLKDMTADERLGWGIYHCMIDDNCGYDQVTKLTEGVLTAKFDEFYGPATSMMQEKSGYIDTTLSASTYAKIIIGTAPISSFEDYVEEYNANGGKVIIEQVNQWYQQQWKGEEE